MFRMKACYMITANNVEVRIKSDNFTNYITINKPIDTYEFDFKMLQGMRRLVRDELHRKYGIDNWRKAEWQHLEYIRKSFTSCAKRMKQVGIFRQR